MHKARENVNGSFSIGKTWPLDDLTAVQSFSGATPTSIEEEQRQQWAGGVGFIVTIGKPYYWQANTQKEKQFFIASLIKIFLKYTGGKSPELLGFDEKEREQLGGIQTNQARPPPGTTPSRAPVQTPPSTSSTPSQNATRPPRRPPSREPIRQPGSQDHINHPLPSDLTSSTTASFTSQNSRPPVLSRREESPVSSVDYNGVTPQPSQANLRKLAAGNQSQESFNRSDDSSLPPRSRGGMSGLSNAAGRFPDRSGTPASMPASLRAVTPDSVASSNKDMISDAPPVPAPLSLPPERRRPPMPVLSDSSRSRRQDSNDNMVPAPLMSPAMRRDEMKLPQRSADREQPLSPQPLSAQGQANGFAVADAFGVASKISGLASPQQSKDSISDAGRSQVTDSLPTTRAIDSTPTTPVEPPPEPQEEERPGLGPMIKKKSKADIASQFRKAASAANAFKPRAGGAAERLRVQQLAKAAEGPDGITGVVPAPSLVRGLSNDSARTAPPDTSLPDIPVVSKTSVQASTLVPSSKDGSVASRQNDKIPEVHITVPQSDQRSSVEGPFEQKQEMVVPEKAKTREPRRPKPASEVTQKQLESLGIDPSILDGKGAEFSNLLDEFGWVGDGVRSRNIDQMKDDVERELNKVQAGGWLNRLEEEDERVEAIKKGLDVCIAEVDELDGLLTLYGVELGVSSEMSKLIT
jgi:hypothetical protein